MFTYLKTFTGWFILSCKEAGSSVEADVATTSCPITVMDIPTRNDVVRVEGNSSPVNPYPPDTAREGDWGSRHSIRRHF